jgi:hypothetical protein
VRTIKEVQEAIDVLSRSADVLAETNADPAMALICRDVACKIKVHIDVLAWVLQGHCRAPAFGSTVPSENFDLLLRNLKNDLRERSVT